MRERAAGAKGESRTIQAEQIVIDADRSRLDLALIQAFLSEESYWAAGVPLEVVQRAIEHSLCFGVYAG